MNEQLHLDTGARALDALPLDEAAAFDAHLDDCDPCTEELAGFTETLAMLGAAVAEPPPAGLHGQVMRQIAITAQLPPLDPASVGTPATAGVTDRGPGEVRGDHTVTPIRRWYRRPTSLLMAAAVAAVLIVGGVVLGTRGGGAGSELAALQQCVQSAPDAQVIRPAVGTGGQVTVAVSCNAAIIDIGTMPAVPTDKGYQLWVMAGSQARSVGMVQEGSDRLKSTFVTSLRQGDTDIGISLEPAGGSAAPTTSPLWVVPLPA